jgi:hypothetical protein
MQNTLELDRHVQVCLAAYVLRGNESREIRRAGRTDEARARAQFSI